MSLNHKHIFTSVYSDKEKCKKQKHKHKQKQNGCL